jgi:hypothetical protein
MASGPVTGGAAATRETRRLEVGRKILVFVTKELDYPIDPRILVQVYKKIAHQALTSE